MRFFAVLLLSSIFFLTPAVAAETPSPVKGGEVPFREDSGLITAEYYLATGKYAQALDTLGGVLTRHPQNADAYVYRGYAYERLGEMKKARDNYERALAINPAHLGANKYMAGLYLADNDLSRAMEQMQAIRLICAGTDCAELDELEADINKFKRKDSAAQAPE